MSCIDRYINADILNDCEIPVISGLESNIIIIPIDYVDKGASVIDATNDLILTQLSLISGKSGFLFAGVKNTNTGNFEIKKAEYGKYYNHKVTGVVQTPNAANRKALYDLINGGGRYIVVVERLWKGADSADAFMVYGWDYGLEGSVHSFNSADKDGAEIFELMTNEKMYEGKPALTLLSGDYSTTKTAFENKFAAA